MPKRKKLLNMQLSKGMLKSEEGWNSLYLSSDIETSSNVPCLIFRVVHIVINLLSPIVIVKIIIDFLVQTPIMVIVICIRVKIILDFNAFGFCGFLIVGISLKDHLNLVVAHIIFDPDSAVVLFAGPLIIAVFISNGIVDHSIGPDFPAVLVDQFYYDISLILNYTVVG